MEHDELMAWFRNSKHEIILRQTNKNNIVNGIAICKETNQSYNSSGNDICDVLNDLKKMLEGRYHELP